MKYVYLMRHGESQANAGEVTSQDSSLTELGRKQAEFLADRCSRLPIEVLVSSTMKRARETAEIISKKIGKQVEFTDLVRERRLTDGHMSEKERLEIIREADKQFTNPSFRYGEAENFTDLKNRAKKSLEFFESRKEEHIGVVMHGTFMRLVVGEAVFGDRFTAELCLDMLHNIRTKNTGITVLVYHEDIKKWRLLTWNDHAHLG